MKNTTTITIDLAKDVFQVAVFNKYGKKLINKGMNSKRLVQLVLQHPEACIYMEACGSAHYWGRRFTQLGYKAQLIPPHLVAKYRSGNKSDKNDAVAIYEASKNPNIYFVTIRTLEQQDLAIQHKLRSGYIKQRTQLGNRIRSSSSSMTSATPTRSVSRKSKATSTTLPPVATSLPVLNKRPVSST